MNDKAKGWVYVLIQGLLFVTIVFSSVFERKYLSHPNNKIISYIGIVLVFSGVLLFLTALINFGQKITPNPVPKETYELRTTGLYSTVRHPMYFSFLILFTGVVLYFQAYFSFVWIILLLLFFINKIQLEEKYLSEKFHEYKEYQSTTKRLIPFIY